MFLRAGWKAGLSNFWGLLFFWETGGSGQAGRAVETCTGGEGAASWVSALPTGTGRGERSLNSSRCFLEKCKGAGAAGWEKCLPDGRLSKHLIIIY